MTAFEGQILQMPPRYSAKKLGGKPGLQAGPGRRGVHPRAGRRHRRPVRSPATIGRPSSISRPSARPGPTSGRSPTTWAQRLGCGAHLAALRRTSVGPYDLAECRLPGQLRGGGCRRVEADRLILPLEQLLPSTPVGRRSAGSRGPRPEWTPPRAGAPRLPLPGDRSRKERRRTWSGSFPQAANSSPWPARPPTGPDSIPSSSSSEFIRHVSA